MCRSGRITSGRPGHTRKLEGRELVLAIGDQLVVAIWEPELQGRCSHREVLGLSRHGTKARDILGTNRGVVQMAANLEAIHLKRSQYVHLGENVGDALLDQLSAGLQGRETALQACGTTHGAMRRCELQAKANNVAARWRRAPNDHADRCKGRSQRRTRHERPT